MLTYRLIKNKNRLLLLSFVIFCFIISSQTVFHKSVFKRAHVVSIKSNLV